MSTNFKLKPFRFNLTDLNFIRDQINFRPLFDAAGNAIIAWNGTGAVYDSNNLTSRTLLWDGVFVGTGGTGIHDATEAIAAFGTSYATVTSAQGLRDVSGQNNNLLLVNKFWGSADQPFLQTVAPDFASYIKPMAAGDTGAFYANNTFGASTTGNNDYTRDSSHPGNTPTTNPLTTGNVVDYTPRMISRLITTGGATPLLDASGQVVHWNAALYAGTDPAALVYQALVDSVSVGGAGLLEGAAIMQTLGIAGMGGAQQDPQDPTNGELFFGAINPGVAPGNSFLAYFGQFFDHGLDFIDKGAAGTKITIPLAVTDPLYRAPGTDGPLDQGNTKITVARANIVVDDNGDPVFDANGNVQWINHTSPYIDQSQTYGSHADVTSLLREWVSTDGGVTFHAGAHLLDGKTSASWTNAWGETTTATLPTLNELRAHLVATGRADLTWNDMGNFRGTSGQALLLDSNSKFDAAHLFSSEGAGINSAQDNAVVDAIAYLAANALRPGAGDSFAIVDGALTLTLGSPMALGPPGSPSLPTGTVLTDRAALIAWVNMGTLGITATDPNVFAAVQTILLASVGDHYIAGDGRVNENVALTTIHHVFHEEHNYQVRNIQDAIIEQDARAVALGDNSHSIAHFWQTVTTTQDAAGNYTYGIGGAIAWDEAKLFDAAKLTVEMEYQHAAVDQYARTITPDLPEFVGYNSGTNATVSIEYAQGAFRFGHSTIRESIDYLDPNGSITNKVMSVALEQAFLNPALFADKGAASIALGLTHQQMNEVDELLTPALNQGLLGQPLDLAAINIARGRDIGLPTLNDFREGVGLTRYTSWSDFGANMVHPESLANFIAAYSFDGNVAKAAAIIGLEDGSITQGDPAAMGYTVDQAIAFLNGDLSVAGADGYNHIDTWIGGLAEVHVMGGLLGETFNLVFVEQINRLMDGDRFYYLYRLNNMNLGDEIGNAQLKDIVERNTGLEHLNGSIFAYADQYIDLSAKVDTVTTTDTGDFKNDHKYGQILEDRATVSDPAIGVYSTSGTNISSNGSIVTIGGVQYIRDIRAENLNLPNVGAGVGLDGAPTTGANSNEVLVGTDNKDLLYLMAGDDTAYGEGGNDIIYGGAGIDRLYGGDGADEIHGGDSGDLIDGGAGDDILYGETSGSAAAGVDQIIGSDGNDIIYGGVGIDKLSGGRGDDVIFGGSDTDAFTHGGDGNDYIDGESDGDLLWGDGGDDLVVGGNNQDIVAGGDGDDILRPGNPSSALGGGPDEVLGGDGVSDAGNDGKGTGFDIIDFSDYVAAAAGGVNADFSTQQNPLVAIDGSIPFPAWVGIEGMIGTRNNDSALGDANANWLIGGSGNDSLTGGAGNDVIIGDGIRLDSLIGTYSGTYTHEFDGATHRAFDAASTAAERVIQNNGLLANTANGTQGFDKHHTEMLMSERFKDLNLGGSAVTTLLGGGTTGDGGTAGTADVARFQGAIGGYTFARIDFTDAHGTVITAIKVTDGTPDRDGTDILVGVEFATFNGGALVDLSVYTNHEPTLTGAQAVLGNGTEDVSYTLTAAALLQGFTDADGNPLSVANLISSSGTVVNNNNGTYTITPGTNFNGSVTLSYNVVDGVGGQYSSVAATQTFTLDAVNDAPVVANTAASGTEDDTVISGAVPAATDIDLDALTYSVVGATPAGVTFNADGTFEVVPGLADQGLDTGESRVFSFQYVANDGTVDSAPATVTVTINGVNDAPISGGDAAASGSEDEALISGAVAAGSDTDVEALTYSVVGAAPAGVTFNADGTFSVAPNVFDQGLDDGESRVVSFDYVANDGALDSAPATVTVTINGVNDAPVSGGDASATGTEDDATISGAVTAAADVDGEALTYSVVGAAPAGVSFNNDGTFSVAPSLADQGLDSGESRVFSFQYVANDGTVDSAPATVTVTINGVNDAPVSGGDASATGTEDNASISGQVAAASDVDVEPLIYSVVGITPAGVTFNPDGSFSVAPSLADQGLDTGESRVFTFQYVAFDGALVSVPATVTVTINGVNDAPTGGVTISLSTPVPVVDQTLSASNSLADLDGLGPISYQWQSSADSGATWANIAGATSANFLTTAAQLGQQLRVTASYSDGAGPLESVSSLPTAAVAVFNIINGTTGPETINGTALRDQINGNGGNDILNGLAGDDALFGADGNDVLDGGTGVDQMTGGAGNDSYFVRDVGDTVIEAAGAAGGSDAIATFISYTQLENDNVEALRLAGTGAIDGTGNSAANLIYSGAGNNVMNGLGGVDWAAYSYATSGVTASLLNPGVAQATGGSGSDTLLSIENLIGSNHNDTLTGDDGANALIGGTGNDSLNGGGGNDILNGGLGDDAMAGGAGNDIYIVDSSADTVTEALNEGTDTVNSSASFTLTGNTEILTLSGIADINGTGDDSANTLNGNAGANILTGGLGNDVLNGNAGIDTLNGGAGNDTLNGGLGNDIMAGGADNDTYTVDSTTDTVTEALNEGTDTVNSSATFTLADNIEALTLTGSAAINGTGNGGANTLTGNAGINTLTGGAGNDSYFVQNTGDVVIELAGGGSDAISTTVTYTLSDNVEALRLAGTGAIDGFGNAAGNLIYSGAGNNLMDGLGGMDMVSYFYAASGVNVSLLNPGVAQATGGSGSDTLLSIESLIGSNFNDTLTGDGGANTLNGSTGNDSLSGGSGSDVLIGGVGNDIFAFSAANFGTDVVADFDAINDANGFDLLDLSGLGIGNLAQYDAARLSNALTITDVGADTLVSYAGGSIRLVGVADATTINSADFLLV